MSSTARIVVLCPTRQLKQGLLPPASAPADKVSISGGERSLYELATAVAATGRSVELRGDFHPGILRTVVEAAEVVVPTPESWRPLEQGDVVVFPETIEPAALANLVLSPARLVLFLLSPLGLISWDGTPAWHPPSVETVPLEALCRPEGFQALAALGCDIWTHAEGIAARGQAAGVAVRLIGEGSPVAPAEVPAREYDVAVVMQSRWADWALEAVRSLPSNSVLKIGRCDGVYSLADQLGRARVLVFPSRVEGLSRVAREARLVGTVPVMLSTNPFMSPDDWGEGLVLVDSLEEIPAVVEELLADHARLEGLSVAAVSWAMAHRDFPGFVRRVDLALAELGEHVVDGFREAFSREVPRWIVEAVTASVAKAVAPLEERSRVEEENIARLNDERDARDKLLAEFRARRSVRWADALGSLRRRR